MTVTPLRVPEPERLALVLRQAGFVSADEVMDLENWQWELYATIAGLDEVPTTAVRCAVVVLFGLPSETGAQVPDAPPAAGCSPASLSEPVDHNSMTRHGRRSTGSIERRTS